MGDQSYQVSLDKSGNRELLDVHWDFIKPYTSDWVSNSDVPLYYHKGRTHTTLIEGDYDMVEEILDHTSRDGKLLFHVKWKNNPKKTRVAPHAFVHGCSSTFLTYVRRNNLLSETHADWETHPQQPQL